MPAAQAAAIHILNAAIFTSPLRWEQKTVERRIS
jgi:hypothetical protein